MSAHEIEKSPPYRRISLGVPLQWAALLSLGALVWFWPPAPPTPAVRTGPLTNWEGFLALSYPGLRERSGGGALTSERLRQHLLALSAAGFQPISLEEAGEFLRCRAPLPAKAVLLTFDDGRRETAREAERVLRELRWPAVLFVQPEAMEKSDTYYPTWRDLRGLASTGHWSFGSRGCRGREWVETEGGKGRGLFLVSRAQPPEKERAETDEEWKARVRNDVRGSEEIIRRRLGMVPGVFAFPCSDDGRKMPDGGEALRRIVVDSFPLAFTQAGYAFNEARRPPLELRRLLVRPEWSGQEVVEWLEAQAPRRSPFTAGSEKDWVLRQGRFRVEGGRVVLEPQEWWGAEAWLAGSEPWRCLRGEVTVETRPDTQAWVCLRAAPGRRYVRLGWSGRRIEVQTRVDGGEVQVLACGSPVKGATRAKVTFDLFDQRIRFALEEGEAPARSFPLPREIGAGLAGLLVYHAKGGNTPVSFEGLRLEPRLARGVVVRSLEQARRLDNAAIDVLSPAWYEVSESGGGVQTLSDPDPALVHLAAFRGASLWPLVRLPGPPSGLSLGSLARSLHQLAISQRWEGLLLDPRPARAGDRRLEPEDILEILGSDDIHLGLVLERGCEKSWVARLWPKARWIAVSPGDPAASWIPPERLLFLEEPRG